MKFAVPRVRTGNQRCWPDWDVKIKDHQEYLKRLAAHFPVDCAFEPMLPSQTQFELQNCNLGDNVAPNEVMKSRNGRQYMTHQNHKRNSKLINVFMYLIQIPWYISICSSILKLLLGEKISLPISHPYVAWLRQLPENYSCLRAFQHLKCKRTKKASMCQ